MGFRKLLVYYIISLFGVILFFAYSPSPILLDIQPRSYSIKLPEKFEKGLSYNERLSSAQVLFENEAVGPESLAYYKGAIYTGLQNGDIIKIKDGKSTVVVQLGKQRKGRALGLRFDKNGLLYFVDVFNGLCSLDMNTGKVTTLLSYGQDVDGKKITFPDDMDIDDNGVIYMSDGSTKFDLSNVLYMAMEHDKSGRVVAYDTKTGETSVLVADIAFPNGIQLTHDKKALLISEFFASTVIKFHLEGPKKGLREVFANLPGEPDNIRPSKRGGYWVALTGARNSTSKTFVDHMSEMPLLRKVLARMIHSLHSVVMYIADTFSSSLLEDFCDTTMEYLVFHTHFFGKSALVLELNENGEIVQSLHSSDHKWLLLSEVLEQDGFLYLGSFLNPYLGKVKL